MGQASRTWTRTLSSRPPDTSMVILPISTASRRITFRLQPESIPPTTSLPIPSDQLILYDTLPTPRPDSSRNHPRSGATSWYVSRCLPQHCFKTLPCCNSSFPPPVYVPYSPPYTGFPCMYIYIYIKVNIYNYLSHK